MKLFLISICFILCLSSAFAEEKPLRVCAYEDFRRLPPGDYPHGRDAGTWHLVERDGKNILCVDKETEVMIGWRFLDIRQYDYVIRYRFRFLEENKFMNFTFHGDGLSEYKYFHYRFRLFPQKAFLFCNLRLEEEIANEHKPNPVKHVPSCDIRQRLKINEWYELEIHVYREKFDSYVIYPDGKTVQILISPILPGARLSPSLYFSGKAEVEWIKSYLLPEPKQE